MPSEKPVVPGWGEGEANPCGGKRRHPAAAGQLLQVDDKIKACAGHFPIPEDFSRERLQARFVQAPDARHMRIAPEDRFAFFFGEDMQFAFGIAAFEQFQTGRAQNHVTDLAELANKNARRNKSREVDGRHGHPFCARRVAGGSAYSTPTSFKMLRHVSARLSV